MAAVLASACGDERGNPGGASTATLTGTVLDRATRLGLSGARVEVVEGANVGRAATTDGSGAFRLQDLGPGQFTVRITHPEYQDELQSVTSPSSVPTWTVRPRPCETPACGGPNGCNRVMPFLHKPFAGEHFASNAFDHDTPRGFGSENGIFVSSCGRPATYDGHNGYDWVMPEGTPILAVAAGTVTSAGQENPFHCPFLGRQVSGTFVTIQHASPTGESFWSQYLHLSALAVARGQTVAAGEVIGASGNTGCSTGPHLHFAVFREVGNPATPGFYPTDPYGWQGSGNDPWAIAANGAYSAWIWAAAPLVSFGGERVRELHSRDTASRGMGR